MTIYVGAATPEAIKLVVKDPTFNFATVTGTDLQVKAPGADVAVTWGSWALDASVSGQITLTRPFAAGGGDVPKPGRYTITGRLLTASSSRRITPAYFDVQLYQ